MLFGNINIMKLKALIVIPQALDILKMYHTPDSKPDDYVFPFLDNNAEYAKFVSQSEKDSMPPKTRQLLFQHIAAKNALLNKYLKKTHRSQTRHCRICLRRNCMPQTPYILMITIQRLRNKP